MFYICSLVCCIHHHVTRHNVLRHDAFYPLNLHHAALCHSNLLQCNDGHGIGSECPYATPAASQRAIARFLRSFLSALRTTNAYRGTRTLVLVNYDESSNDYGPNQVRLFVIIYFSAKGASRTTCQQSRVWKRLCSLGKGKARLLPVVCVVGVQSAAGVVLLIQWNGKSSRSQPRAPKGKSIVDFLLLSVNASSKDCTSVSSVNDAI